MAASIRHRYHTHIRDAVKRPALRQLTEGGPQAVSINAIAKELGVSGPALYRYFAGRDELMTALAVDAYDDLAEALSDTGDRPAHRYGLLFAEIPSAALRRELKRRPAPAASTPTQRQHCAPSRSGRACTASSASKSAATSPR